MKSNTPTPSFTARPVSASVGGAEPGAAGDPDVMTWESDIGPALLPPEPAVCPPAAPEIQTIQTPTTYTLPRLEAESGLLGAILIEEDRAWPAIEAQGITADDFHDTRHRLVFKSASGLHKNGRPVDILTVSDDIERRGLTAKIGGATALDRLVDACPTCAYAPEYARLVAEDAQRRRLGQLAASWSSRAATGAPDLLGTIRKDVEREARRTAGSSDDLAGVSLSTLAESKIDESATLLGIDDVRYLCRGGNLLFVGPSGVGKSTASAQQDILWALGRPAFGIAPALPLRIVTVQAENDTGDMIHMARGIVGALKLNTTERETVDRNTRYLSHSTSTGGAFLAFLDRVLQMHKPDLLRIDPLMAYIGGDLTKPEVTAEFCRNGLGGLAKKHNCGIVVCHHTPKQTSTGANAKARKAWGAFDWQYAAAGSADLVNWCRAELIIEPLSRDVFAFRAAKRWPGWKMNNGEAEHVRHFRREREYGKVFWHDATPGDVMETAGIMSADAVPDLEAFQNMALPLVKAAPLPAEVFDSQLARVARIGVRAAHSARAELVFAGTLVSSVREPKKNGCKYIGTPDAIRALETRWESPEFKELKA